VLNNTIVTITTTKSILGAGGENVFIGPRCPSLTVFDICMAGVKVMVGKILMSQQKSWQWQPY
jgi:hypothetical protein